MFPTAAHPDASNTLQTLLDGPSWQYFEDKELRGHLDAGLKEFDEQKRAAIYQKAFDRINSQHYLFPLSSVPNAYVHTPDIEVRNNTFMAGDTTVADYFWK
jgi:ABC-type transport system substrate-binding protein